jgi:hypothetical protein
MADREILAAYCENRGQNTEANQLVLKCQSIYYNAEIKTSNTGKHFNEQKL